MRKIFYRQSDDLSVQGAKSLAEVNAKFGQGDWQEIEINDNEIHYIESGILKKRIAITQEDIDIELALIRLKEIDNEVGPRAVREALIELGKKGFNNKIETLENEAVILRGKIVK